MTGRLVLREFQEYDWQALARYWSDPLYLEYYEVKERDESDVRDLADRFIAWSRQRPRACYQLAIVLQADDFVIGTVGIRLAEAGDLEGELGLELDPDHWGQGLASEAAQEMLRFGFRDLELETILTSSVTENHRATRLVEALGMVSLGLVEPEPWMPSHGFTRTLHSITERVFVACRTSNPGHSG